MLHKGASRKFSSELKKLVQTRVVGWGNGFMTARETCVAIVKSGRLSGGEIQYL
jgi:hypothetical protein